MSETNEQSNNRITTPKKLFDHVKKFNFPRLAGSEGEKKAVDLSIQTFEELGYSESEIQTEEFEFSDFYSTTLIKLIMTLSLTFTLILIFLLYIYPWVTIVLIGIMAIVVFLITRGLRTPEKKNFWGEYFGNILEATNVFVKIPASEINESEAGNIVISAHLDSKSQSIKTLWRVIIYRIWLYSGVLLGGVFIWFLLYQIGVIQLESRVFMIGKLEIVIINLAIWPLTILIAISNIVLMFLNTHNKSPGALDNASGMAIVFELSSYFRDKGLKNFNLWFCQFSAEELGTMGSRIFVNNHEDQFEKGKVYQINFDMVSAAKSRKNQVEYLKSYGVYPRKKIAPELSGYLNKAASKNNIKIYGFHLSTGAHTDCVPFHLKGYHAIDLSTRAAALYSHSKEDTLDKVDPQVLEQACILTKDALFMLDQNFNNET
ncbi:MAG: M28 family peptidase [Candidatus Lokiarchaeota archaeon]|nr:M28 family peptidase [Candidatus Lokiarchaeota archaeon]MBD3340719.1 M28 family peptidase [Candidatus Lokiarchaeota archaeon]